MNIMEILLSERWLPAFIVVLSPIAAFITDFLLSFIFKRFASKTKTTFDDKLLAILHQPIFYSVFFIGWMIALNKTGNVYSQYVISFLLSLIILIWSKAVFRAFIESVQWYAKRGTRNKMFQQRMIPLFENLGKLFIFLFCAYLLFNSWGWDVTGWLASAGVIGIVVGLAAKDTLANFFSGVFIMADAPYKEKDYIILDSGERGYVSNIGLRSTRILTRDDIEITIPNSVIANSKIVNESGGPGETERVRITLQISYNSNIDEVKSLLNQIAIKNEDVLKEPEPRVRFREFTDYGIRLQLLFWIRKPEIRGRTVDSINMDIYNKFSEKNILIPYPTMNVVLPKK